tara:strand:- start:60 stop:476 length:417 start_codon:yes stop_codon:yes gene_type:complete
MTKKTITMPEVEPRKFYRQYIEILQPILKLRKREADVFAELLYHNYLKRDIKDAEDRFKLVFDISTRNKISDRLNISNAVIQQALGGLRKKNVIKGITLRETFAVEPEDGVFNLHFKFVVKDNLAFKEKIIDKKIKAI